MNLCFVGDCIPGQGMPFRACPLGRTIGNLECAFSDDAITGGKAYTSVLPVERIELVPNGGFAALSVANNHVYDAGGSQFGCFIKELMAKGVHYFGTRDHPFADLTDGQEHVAVIGCLEPCRSRGPAIFRQEDVEGLVGSIRSKFQFIYVYPHWGKEGEYTHWPSPSQRRLARRWIDAGADGVFGCHSHVFQGRETYRGKPIYYSLGNYCFDHPESRLYKGTEKGLVVEIAEDGQIREMIMPMDGSLRELEVKERQLLEDISSPLASWTTWRWAKAIGQFNINKNMASWHIRLKKQFVKTLPKFLIWQILPQTVLFRIASMRQACGRQS